MGLVSVRDGDTPETIFDRADKALYKSKHSCRNQLHYLRGEDLPAPASADAAIEVAAATLSAAENLDFQLYFNTGLAGKIGEVAQAFAFCQDL